MGIIKKSIILKRYQDACGELHISSDLCKAAIIDIGRHIKRFGKNILITDITDWTTDDIVLASLDRWAVEDGFRLTKDENQIL